MSINGTIKSFFFILKHSQKKDTLIYPNYTLTGQVRHGIEAFKLPKHLKIGWNKSEGYGEYLIPVTNFNPPSTFTLGKAYSTAVKKYGYLECLPFEIANTTNTTVLISSACAFIKETLELLFWITTYNNELALFITTKCFEETTPTQITQFIRKLLIPNAENIPIHIVPNCKVLAPNQLKKKDIFTKEEIIAKIEANMQRKKEVEAILLHLKNLLYNKESSDPLATFGPPIVDEIIFLLESEAYENMYLQIQTFIMEYFTHLSADIITQLQLLLKAIKPLIQGNYESALINTPSNTTIGLTFIQ